MPWYWRWLGMAAIVAATCGVAWFTYDFGLEYAGFRKGEATKLREKLDETVRLQQVELNELNARTAAAERQLQIERATYGDLAKQVKALEQENATLKEDLAFFQSLTATGKEGAISVNRFRMVPDSLPGEYRYQLLLVQAGERAKEFHGRLQFVLNLQQDGRKVTLMIPESGRADAKEYQVNFKLFQRVEGLFRIAPNATVKGLQVRIFEGNSDTPKLTHNVNIS
jgi:FtsZ-binding cell division protein ZapB